VDTLAAVRRPYVLVVVASLLGFAVGAAACGDESAGSPARPELRVAAATSLKTAFTAYGEGFEPATARFSFAASDQLAGQIRSGIRPDVFAAANAKLPDALHAEGLVDEPVAFARNRLVIAVPKDGSRVRSIEDLALRGVRLAIGADDVPIGDYTRKVLAQLPAARRAAITDNIRSEEPDVGGIVGKVAAGAVDAGFVYITDVRASDGRLRAIALPAALRPEVVYEAAVVRGARQPAAARAFVAGLLSGPGAAELRQAGFLPPR